MALRVLLADESSTIKKVFQLALQDFAVEVRPVNIGVDVSSVATSFKPDIIFADVLLQKKNGYDVCSELKQDGTLNTIPVVLMWSGFMEFDEDKFQASQANAQLEKPFDVSALRKLVTELVPRTQNQRLSQFLTFPKANSGAEKASPALPPEPPSQAKNDEDFTAVSMVKKKLSPPAQSDKYRVNLKPEELDPNHIAVEYELPSESIRVDEIFKDSEPVTKPDIALNVDEEFTVRETMKAKAATSPPPLPQPVVRRPIPERVELEEEVAEVSSEPPAAAPVTPALSAEQLEKIIRQQSAEIIETVVWKVIPELATQIIERELNRLLKERDSRPF